MNYCLRNDCPKGYAFIKGFPYQLDSFGSFRYVVTFSLIHCSYYFQLFIFAE